MFSIVAKIIKRLAMYPKAVTLLLLALTICCVYPINHLRWELQLQDTLKGSEVQEDYEAIEEAFGGLGSLTVVLQSEDSLANFKVAEEFARTFRKDSSVHFIEYTADVQFFEKNKLLYASEDDLSQVISYVEKYKEEEILKKNPFYVDLEAIPDSSQNDSISEAGGYIRQVEEKYFRNLQQSYSSTDGKVRVIDIYPTHSLSDLQANRDLYHKVADYMKEKAVPAGIQVRYTGKIYNSVLTGRMLLPEAKFAGAIAAVVILLLLVVQFRRQPQLILISAIPIAMPLVFTLAIAFLLYGRINVFALPLLLLLPGHACQLIVHIHTRYFHERERNLSPALCIESAILGIGPAVTASSLVMAGLFLSLNFIPIPGLKEFGNLGAIGTLQNLIICPLLATAFLRFLQRKKSFNVISTPAKATSIRLLPNKVNKVIIAIISVVSLAGILYSGTNLTYLYDFSKTEIKHNREDVDTLINKTGFSTFDPIIVMMPDSSYSDELLKDFSHLQERKKIPDLGRIYTQYQFLPKESQEKKSKIEYLRNLISPEVLSSLGREDSSAIVTMLNNYDSDFKEFDLSPNIKRKFSDKDGNSGVFAFIIPNVDPDNGLYCRHMAQQLREIEGVQDHKFKVCGTPVLRASILDLILSNVGKSIIFGTIILWFILLLFFNNLSRAIFVMFPSIFAMSWLTIVLYSCNFHISAYSALAIVLLIGASVDGSLQLWSSYFEKQGGTAVTVLKTKLSSVLVSQLATLLGPLALIFSSHPGIRGMGQICLIGLVCIFVAQLTIYPLIAGALDNYRLRKKKRSQNDKTALQ